MTKDRLVALLALGLGGIYLAGTLRVPVAEAADATGPRAFPLLVSATVIVSGLLLLVQDHRRADRRPLPRGFGASRAEWLRIGLTMVAGIAYGLALDWLGYPIATFLFMLVVSSAINVRRHVENLVLSAGFAAVTFVAFGVLLKLSIPRGVLGSLLPF